jgi:hypothetical protein
LLGEKLKTCDKGGKTRLIWTFNISSFHPWCAFWIQGSKMKCYEKLNFHCTKMFLFTTTRHLYLLSLTFTWTLLIDPSIVMQKENWMIFATFDQWGVKFLKSW